MKLDYLKEGSDDCPLVRLYDFDSTDAHNLKQIFNALAEGSLERVDLEIVESVDGSHLTFVRCTRDRGVVESTPRRFEVLLTSEGWWQAADSIVSFCDGGVGYKWLTPQTNGIQWLFSKNGSW
ncbi:MAG: hypothetical protein ACK4UN_15230 [Limisphaerales bacterium]